MSSIWTVRRSARDVKVAGLCGGVAEKWDVDPILVRIAFVLLALSAGIGLVLYLAGWLLLPVEGKQTAPVDDLFGETRLGQLVETHAHLPSEELRERMLREIAAFVGDAPQHDDMTMILVKVDEIGVGAAAFDAPLAESADVR